VAELGKKITNRCRQRGTRCLSCGLAFAQL